MEIGILVQRVDLLILLVFQTRILQAGFRYLYPSIVNIALIHIGITNRLFFYLVFLRLPDLPAY